MSALENSARLLWANPSDLDLWLEVATGLVAAGADDAGNRAFAQLGRAANRTGRAALAVACSRFLAPRDAQAAEELVDAIASTHAAGSEHVDSAARPPLPQSRAAAAPAAGLELSAAIKLATEAVDAAASATPAADKQPPTPLLSALSKSAIHAFIGAMTVRAFRAGQVVINTGEPATALYWLARGRATVSRDGKALADLGAGAFFGEIALVAGSLRTATVTTTTDALALEILTDAVERAARAEPKVAEVLAHHARTRLLSNLMQTSDVFTALPTEDRAGLLAKFTPTLVAAGTRIIEAGKDNAHLWLVVSGRCSVQTPHGEVIAGPGAVVGEMSLITRQPATADVVAADPCSMLRLSRKEFDEVAGRHPEVLAKLYTLLVSREQANVATPSPASATVVV